MNVKQEIGRRDKKIEDDKKVIAQLREEVTGLKELLDCAVANIVMLVKESGGRRKISKQSVGKVLGQYRLYAKDDDDNYILEIKENMQKCRT